MKVQLQASAVLGRQMAGYAAVEGVGKIRDNLYTLVIFLFTALVIASLYHQSGDRRAMQQDQIIHSNSVARCDLFSGRWVYDSTSYPLYNEQQCFSFLHDDLACQTFGRKDLKYLHWRWQPHGCDLPSFNATAFLEKLRGKRLVFVGDSLNRNQWSSLVCLLESSAPPSLKSVSNSGSFNTFQAFEYNATIEFYWEPMLVESNYDDPTNHHVGVRKQIARIGSIEKHARLWTDSDILVFNSFLWWMQPDITLLWGSFNSSDGFYKEADMNMKLRAYEMALQTLSDWLELNVNRSKTKLYFMSLSPYHLLNRDGGSSADQSCCNETEPIMQEGYRGRATDQDIMRIAQEVTSKLETRGLKMEYLNITQLSDYRKDAHPSIYRKPWVPLTKEQLADPKSYAEEQLADPKSYADCIHWCLPGVPDVWNQILYAYVMQY